MTRSFDQAAEVESATKVIDELIAARESITNLTDEFINYAPVDHIDNALRILSAPGRRDDVDRLLGRKITDYGPDAHAAVIAARNADAALPKDQRRFWHAPIDWLAENMTNTPAADANQVSLADMMLQTGRIDHAQWIAQVWHALPEIEY